MALPQDLSQRELDKFVDVSGNTALRVANPDGSTLGTGVNPIGDATFLQDEATGNGNGSSMVVAAGALAFVVIRDGTNLINFEYTIDSGANWLPLYVRKSNTTDLISTTTESGGYVADVLGMPIMTVRARISGYSSGTVTVTCTQLNNILSYSPIQYSAIQVPVSNSVGGLNIWSNIGGDFIATPTVGQKTIVFSSYANSILSSAINVNNFLNATIKRINSSGAIDYLPVTNATFATNTLTLADMGANFASGDTVAVFIQGPDKYYNKTNDTVKMELATALSKLYDSIETRPEPTTYLRRTASGVVINQTAILVGMYVNSTSSGTIKLWDNASAGSGTVINETITPAVGYHDLGSCRASNGVYATIGGTIDITFYYIPLS